MSGLPTSASKSKVFISYKRNVDPDQGIAARLLADLTGRGYDVFIDRTMLAGQKWAKEIETQVKGCDFFIPLLTFASSGSEMVRGEIEMARSQAEKSGGVPAILPVRLDFTGPLPYPLNAWLAPIQYAFWKNEYDSERLFEELAAAIAGQPLSLPLRTEFPVPSPNGAPAYAARVPPPGGGLDIDDAWYVARGSDSAAARLMSYTGVTVVIKGSRQMGKTSLLVRVLHAATNLGKRCIFIDFQMLGRESLLDSKTFFQIFARLLAEALDLPDDIEAWWDVRLPNAQNLTRYVERQILQAISEPIVLAIDEADVLFHADFVVDFFAMLRGWHENRAKPMKKMWKRLDLVLVTSTEPYLFIDRKNESPFNVAEVLNLCDFTLDQIEELNASHEYPFEAHEAARLFELLGGQPYLSRKAFYLVKSGTSPSDLFAHAADDRGPFGDHLRYYFLRLADHPDLTTSLKQIALGNGCSDIRRAYRLESAGLVRFDGEKVVPRCNLYAQYFRTHL